MRVLDIKLLRDLWRLKWQALAISVLIAVGVAVTVMAYSSQKALSTAREQYYRETRFADIFATLKRAPLSLTRRLAAINGVRAVDPRIIKSGLMEVRGQVRPAIAQIISLPERDEEALNRIVLMAGRLPDARQPHEAVALKTFLDATGLRLGDEVSTVIGGRRITLRIVGAALSPEYIYMPSPGSTLPDDKHQGIFWMTRAAVEEAADLDGAFNAVAIAITPGRNEAAIRAEVDATLAPYGAGVAIPRADQASHAFLEAEFKELKTSGAIFPPIFLIVAAGLVHLVMSRLVDVEREQIGLLKAFGYSDFEAAVPFLRLATLIGLGGAIMGGALGAWLSQGITTLYREFMRFPELTGDFHFAAFAISALLATGLTAAGALVAVRRATRLNPAVAMAPPRPTTYRAGILDGGYFDAMIDPLSRMILRTLFRFPVRSFMTCVGLAASLMVLLATQFVYDSFEVVLDHSYYRIQRWSDQVGLAEVRGPSAVKNLTQLPGVLAAEPIRSIPVIFRANGIEERGGLIGLNPGSELYRPRDEDGQALPLLSDGLILSEALASKLKVGIGDPLLVEVTEGERRELVLTVGRLSHDYSGTPAYLARPALNRLVSEGDVANGVLLLVASDARADFYHALASVPLVAGVVSRDDTVAAFRDIVTRSFSTTMVFYLGFAGAIAFGVSYNASRIAFSERVRDLATLEVLGFTHAETAFVLAGEIVVLALAAMPLGILGGHLLADAIVAAYGRDEMRLPSGISAWTHGVSLLAFAVAIGLSLIIVVRRVFDLDLVSVLKTRD